MIPCIPEAKREGGMWRRKRESKCVCMCGREWEKGSDRVCVCVSLCISVCGPLCISVCVKGRERESREGWRMDVASY